MLSKALRKRRNILHPWHKEMGRYLKSENPRVREGKVRKVEKSISRVPRYFLARAKRNPEEWQRPFKVLGSWSSHSMYVPRIYVRHLQGCLLQPLQLDLSSSGSSARTPVMPLSRQQDNSSVFSAGRKDFAKDNPLLNGRLIFKPHCIFSEKFFFSH